MASNKNALIRYKTIDNCLRNNYRKWTLNDLIESCSDALYEYEGKDVYVSKRTIQLDIQVMRSDKLGYNAPIEVYDRKFYHYTVTDYSIKNIPVTDKDVKIMNEAIQVLRQFKDFSLFSEMDGVLQRLEDSVLSSSSQQRAVIHLDKNESLKGLEHIDVLYQAILKKEVLKIVYQSFKAEKSSQLIIHPQLLKEFNNRWFLVGINHKGRGDRQHLNLALDRIISIAKADDITFKDINFNGDEYYKDVIGVTVSSERRAQTVTFWVDSHNAPYVKTKPFHKSQTLIDEVNGGTVFSIKVQINFELERLLLGFGDALKVLQPPSLVKRITLKLERALQRYISIE